jgi:hypothetical protein
VGVFVLDRSLDPLYEILVPRRDEWERIVLEAARKVVVIRVVEGQNHIRPPLTLGTDRRNEEGW